MTNGPLARVYPCTSQEVVLQTREIAELIGLGQWVRGVTEHEFAAKHRLSIAAVRERAAEARRLVQHAYGDTEDLRASLLAQLEGIAGETRRKEPRTAVAALLGVAAIAGLTTMGRGEERGTRASKPLPPAERLAEITRIEASLAEAKAQALSELATIDVPNEGPGTPSE